MKIVIPISKSDAVTLPLACEVLLHHGQIPGHEIVLMPTPSCHSDAMDAAQKLRGICTDVTVVQTTADFINGWPRASNNHWHFAVDYLDRIIGNRLPWLWMELDAVPMCKGWAQILYDAYCVADKPFFGFTKDTQFVSDARPEPYTKPGDTFLLGVAIYPPGLSQDQMIKPLFNNMGLIDVNSSPGDPFDVYMRGVFNIRGVHSATQIVDRWRTVNYRREGGQIVCDPLANERFARAGSIPPEAVLVHGCKDGSLQRLVIGGAEKPKTPSLGDAFVPAVIAPIPLATGEAPIRPLSSADLDQQITSFIDSTEKVTRAQVEERFFPGQQAECAKAIIRLGYSVKAWGRIVKREVELEKEEV